MTAERAAKGILVTTSFFGPESYDFVKDKPITLIDGAYLTDLFSQHGHNVPHRMLRRKVRASRLGR